MSLEGVGLDASIESPAMKDEKREARKETYDLSAPHIEYVLHMYRIAMGDTSNLGSSGVTPKSPT